MADANAHLLQWQRNREFIATIPRQCSDWVITVTFYAALHAVDALLKADEAKSINSHSERFQQLQQGTRYRAIYKPYTGLYQLSHVARYSAEPDRWLPREEIEPKVLAGQLYPIEKSVRHLLSTLPKPIEMAPYTPITLKP